MCDRWQQLPRATFKDRGSGFGGGRAEILAPLYCIILICKMGIIKKAQLRRLKLAIKIKISLNNLNCFAKSK